MSNEVKNIAQLTIGELRKQFEKIAEDVAVFPRNEPNLDYVKWLESLVLASDQRERETAWKAWKINAAHTYNHVDDFDEVLEVELFNNWFNEKIKP